MATAMGQMWTKAASTGLPAGTREDTSTQGPDTFEGTIAALNEKENLVRVDGLLTTRTFTVTKDCRVFMGDTPASAGDLRPGQKVKVSYTEVDGKLMSKQIKQQDMIYKGCIARYDVENTIMEIGDSWKSREFEIPPDCAVVLHGNRSGTIANLQIGQHVMVVFESPPDKPYQARKLTEAYKTLSGTVDAIDSRRMTTSVKSFLKTKKFKLTGDCEIILTDGSQGSLRDLNSGDEVEFTYEELDGALVACRLTQKADAKTRGAMQAASPKQE